MFYLAGVVLLPLVGFICCLVPFRRRISADRSCLVFLGAITFGFLFVSLGGVRTVIQEDVNLLQLPFLTSYRDSLLEFRQPPLWNPCLWSGMPNLAHPLSYVFHPTVFLALLLPVHQALVVSFSLAVFFSALFMFLLMKELEQESGLAAISAVVYALSEFTLDRLGSASGPGLEYLYSYAFVPLSLALLLRAARTGSHLGALLFGLSLVFVLNGNPNLLYYALLLLGLSAAFLCVVARRTSLRFTATALVIGLAVFALAGAIELMPLLEMQDYAGRSRLSNIVSGWRMQGVWLGEASWTDLLRLLLPVMERPHLGYASRVGVIASGLALLAPLSWRGKERSDLTWMLLLLGFGLLLVICRPFFEWMLDHLPLFGRMSMIPSVFVFFALPLSVLSGIGAKSVSRRRTVHLALAALIALEMAAHEMEWTYHLRFPRIETYDYPAEVNDFPHLAALNPERTLMPHRVECRGPRHTLLCPEYAVMHHRLRLIDGDKYLFATKDIKELVKSAHKNRLLDVKYILSPVAIEEPGYALKQTIHWGSFREHRENDFRKAMENFLAETQWDGVVHIYQAQRNEHAFLVEGDFDEAAPADAGAAFDVTFFSPMRMTLEGVSPRAGMLLVSEPYYPGWKASVDGVDVAIARLAGGLIGIPIEEGAHTVALSYEPVSFRRGFWISSLTVIAIFLLACLRPPAPDRPAAATLADRHHPA